MQMSRAAGAGASPSGENVSAAPSSASSLGVVGVGMGMSVRGGVVSRDIAKELRALLRNPIEGIRLLLAGEDADCISCVHMEVDGPVGTPYEGGLFRMKLEFGPDFPHQPPKGVFLTRIFHPNIAKTGDICVNALKRDWKPTLGLRHILLVIRCLLIDPNPESALNEEAGKLLLEEYEEYAHHARLMTSIHALPRKGAAASAGEADADEASKKGASSGSEGAPAALEGLQGRAASSEVGKLGVVVHGAALPSPMPLALNSSIANADGGHHTAASTDTAPTNSSLSLPSAATGLEGSTSVHHHEKHPDKKKGDTRKKTLRRL